MPTVNIHEAKTHLSRLLARIAQGDSFIIAKAGKPLAKLVPYEEEPKPPKRRIGFMKGLARVPDDFDTMHGDDIEQMFSGKA